MDSGEAGVGIAFRDDEGKFGPIYSIVIKNKGTPLEVELEALDIAAFLSMRHGFDNVIFQSDSKFLCRMVWGADSVPCEHLVRFLRMGLNRLRAYEVSLTPRESNKVADCLATAATRRYPPQKREKQFHRARFHGLQEERGFPFYEVHRKLNPRKFSTQGFCGQQEEKCKARSEELEKHAVFWLKEAGFEFKNGDFDFSTMDWFDITLTDSLRTRNRTPTKDAPSETDSSPRLPFPQQKIPSLPLWGWSSPFHQTRGLSSPDKSHYTNHIPKSISRSQYSASLDVQAKKQTEPIEQNVPQCQSKLKLARVARLLRRGIRIA